MLAIQKPFESEDTVTAELKSIGVKVSAYYLKDSRLVLGGKFRQGQSEIGYDIKPNDDGTFDLILGSFKKNEKEISLKHAFADVLWFFDLASQKKHNIRYIRARFLDQFFTQDFTPEKMEKIFSSLNGRSLVEIPVKQGKPWFGGLAEEYRQWRTTQGRSFSGFLGKNPTY
jgi:hypothetical protein